MSWSSQGLDTSSGTLARAGVAEFMDTSKHLSGLAIAGLMGTSAILGRHGLRKASRSVSGGTSGLLIQSSWRIRSGLMETSQTGSWPGSGSSRIWKGSLSGLGGRSRSVFNVVAVQMV